MSKYRLRIRICVPSTTHRVGIRSGLTANEELMKNICEMHDIIDFHSA